MHFYLEHYQSTFLEWGGGKGFTLRQWFHFCLSVSAVGASMTFEVLQLVLSVLPEYKVTLLSVRMENVYFFSKLLGNGR